MSDYSQLEAKLKRLRNKFRSTEDRLKIDSLEKTLRRKLITAKIGKIDEVKELIRITEKSIDDINVMLQWDPEITELERKVLMMERRVHLFWIDRLDPKKAREMVSQIEHIVDSKLLIE